MWNKDEQQVDLLLKQLVESDDIDVRSGAAEKLGHFKKFHEKVVPALTKALTDDNWMVRVEAATALSKIGAKAKSSIPAIKEAMNLPINRPKKHAFFAAISALEAAPDEPEPIEEEIPTEPKPEEKSVEIEQPTEQPVEEIPKEEEKVEPVEPVPEKDTEVKVTEALGEEIIELEKKVDEIKQEPAEEPEKDEVTAEVTPTIEPEIAEEAKEEIEEVVEEIAKDIPETATEKEVIQEAIEEVTEETIEDVVEKATSEPIAEETAEKVAKTGIEIQWDDEEEEEKKEIGEDITEIVEDVAEDIKEDTTEDEIIEEAIEEITEEVTEDIIEDTIGDMADEDVIDDIAEDITEEVLEKEESETTEPAETEEEQKKTSEIEAETTKMEDIVVKKMSRTILKVNLVGDHLVGKSTIREKYCGKVHTPSEDNLELIGADFASKHFEVEDENFAMQVWDVVAKDRVYFNKQLYFRGIIGAMLVFDVSNRESYNNIQGWFNDILQIEGKNIAFVLVGNKVDLRSSEGIDTVSLAEGEELAKKLEAELGADIPYIETTMNNKESIVGAFQLLEGKVASLFFKLRDQ